MPCKNCSINPVIELPNSNVNLCKNCFIKYFESKAFKTIRQYNLLEDSNSIAVGISGGKDSLTVLYILNKIASTRKNLKLIAILIDEGIHDYRDITIENAKRFCKENKIELKIYSYKDEFGKSLDEFLKIMNDRKIKLKACTICGVFRRYLLNKKARELKVNKLATGHNLDDEAQAILMNQFKGNIDVSARLGPITGIIKDKRFIPRIKPLYFLTEKEVATYAFLKKFVDKYCECPNAEESYRIAVRDMLNEFENRYPGSKHAIINSFIEILPNLKEKFKNVNSIKDCKICNEPCSSDVCKACELLEKLR